MTGRLTKELQGIWMEAVLTFYVGLISHFLRICWRGSEKPVNIIQDNRSL
jgi:hypothetical protein